MFQRFSELLFIGFLHDASFSIFGISQVPFHITMVFTTRYIFSSSRYPSLICSSFLSIAAPLLAAAKLDSGRSTAMYAFVEAARRLATVSLTILDEVRGLLCRCVEFLKLLLDRRYSALVRVFQDAPLLQSYQGDASPMLVRRRWMHRIGLSSYRHEVTSKVDWYSMRAYLSTLDAEGRVQTRALLRDPVCLPNKDLGILAVRVRL